MKLVVYLITILIIAGCANTNLETNVNFRVNQVPYVADDKDEWKSPQDFFKHGGDCEDYAIAKKDILMKKGRASDDLRLMYVLTNKGKAHMVLADYKYSDDPNIYDNLTNNIYKLSQTRLTPKYMISDKYLWIFNNRIAGKKRNLTTKLRNKLRESKTSI